MDVSMDPTFLAIDNRLERLRAELRELLKDAPQRPSTAPAKTYHAKTSPAPSAAPPPPAEALYPPPGSKFYMTRFDLVKKPISPKKYSVWNPGPRPIGHRFRSRNDSTPAYSMSPKFVLSSRVDPLVPDTSFPGPGAYNTLKY